MAKFTPDGELVKEFGKDGVWFHSQGGNEGRVSQLLPLADGKLLVVSSQEVELQ